MRDTYGVTAMTSVSTGRIIDAGLDHGGAPPPAIVTAGSTWNTVVENSATSRMPTTNSGSPARVIMTTWMTPSVRLPR